VSPVFSFLFFLAKERGVFKIWHLGFFWCCGRMGLKGMWGEGGGGGLVEEKVGYGVVILVFLIVFFGGGGYC